MLQQHPAALRIPPHAARPRFPHGAAGAGGMGYRHFAPKGVRCSWWKWQPSATWSQSWWIKRLGRDYPGKYAMVPGPAASPLMKYRHEYLLRKREGDSGQNSSLNLTEMPAMNPTSKKIFLSGRALPPAAASYGATGGIPGALCKPPMTPVGGDISAISSKVSGYIQQLAVQDNMAVKKVTC